MISPSEPQQASFNHFVFKLQTALESRRWSHQGDPWMCASDGYWGVKDAFLMLTATCGIPSCMLKLGMEQQVHALPLGQSSFTRPVCAQAGQPWSIWNTVPPAGGKPNGNWVREHPPSDVDSTKAAMLILRSLLLKQKKWGHKQECENTGDGWSWRGHKRLTRTF